MKAGILIVAALLLAASPAAAGKTKVKVTVEIEIEVEETTALTEIPTTVESAADAGSTETEMKQAYGAMKKVLIKGVAAKAVGEHFKGQAEKGMSDEGLGDIVEECIAKGLKGKDLVKCVKGEWKKKPPKDRPHPVVKAKPIGKPVTVAPKKPAPPKTSTTPKKHTAVSTGAHKGKKKGAFKAK
ncbi:MAG: hypothetical protein JRG91_00390 [Deltaproteobacteria bacterium]|nr:hypothetical protein [Deltaproteobacteria bacterium]